MKTQTAVEWLIVQMPTAFKGLTINKQLIEQAKEDKKEMKDFAIELSEALDVVVNQQEISDDEITRLADEHILYNDSKRHWVIEGMKLYREQLNKPNYAGIS